MITILTRLGHGRENYLQLLEELQTVPAVHFLVVLHNGQRQVEGVECIRYEGDYHSADTINFGLKYVKTPWLFILDSDEWYTPLQLRKVMEILPLLQAEIQAVAVKRRNFEPRFGTSWHAWPDWQIRFYRYTEKLAWHKSPHATPNVECVHFLTGTSFALLHDHFDLKVREEMDEFFAKPHKD